LSPTTKAYSAPRFTQARTQSAGGIPSLCLAPHMVSPTFPVNVWVPAAAAGMEANPALNTAVAIQHLQHSFPSVPLFSELLIWMRLYRTGELFLSLESEPTTRCFFPGQAAVTSTAIFLTRLN
jgi:hypothetical protein